MAQILAIYGLVASVIMSNSLVEKMALYTGFLQLGAGLAVGLCGLAAGFAIGIVGDAGGELLHLSTCLSFSRFLFFIAHRRITTPAPPFHSLLFLLLYIISHHLSTLGGAKNTGPLMTS